MEDEKKPTPFMTVSRVARYLDMSKDFVYSEIHKGKLSAEQFGSTFKVTKDQLLKYIKEQKYYVKKLE